MTTKTIPVHLVSDLNKIVQRYEPMIKRIVPQFDETIDVILIGDITITLGNLSGKYIISGLAKTVIVETMDEANKATDLLNKLNMEWEREFGPVDQDE